MTPCWSEGELRAYLDGELPARDMQGLEAHLKECSACGALCGDMAGRADRLSVWLGALPETGAAVALPRPPRRSLAGRFWAGAALAIAASLGAALALLPRTSHKTATLAPPPVVSPVAPAPQPPAVQPAIIRREPRKHVVPAKPKPKIEYYVALDDEPIDTGLVVRVNLNGGQVPADVIVGPDGRARAIRLVSDIQGEPK